MDLGVLKDLGGPGGLEVLTDLLFPVAQVNLVVLVDLVDLVVLEGLVESEGLAAQMDQVRQVDQEIPEVCFSFICSIIHPSNIKGITISLLTKLNLRPLE